MTRFQRRRSTELLPTILTAASSHHLHAKRQSLIGRGGKLLSAILCSSRTKIWTLIEFTEIALHFQKRQVLIFKTLRRSRYGPRASDPRAADPPFPSSPGKVYSSAHLALKDGTLPALEKEHRDAPVLLQSQTAAIMCSLWSMATGLQEGLSFYSNQSLGSRSISVWDFILKLFPTYYPFFCCCSIQELEGTGDQKND